MSAVYFDGYPAMFWADKEHRFRGLRVRGKEKAAGEFSLVYVVHNIKKLPRK